MSGKKENEKKQIFPDVMYECVRCGTRASGAELGKLSEPTCANCGYRVFRKVRSTVVKSLKGD